MNSTDNTSQPSVGMRRHLGQRAYTVAYGIAGDDGTTVTVDTRTGAKSVAPSEGPDSPAVRIVFYPWNWTYESVVAAIVNAEIPPDEMAAIQNNYTERVIAPLLDPSAIAVSDPPASATAGSDSESRESASGDTSALEPTDATTAVSDPSEAVTADTAEAIEAERERLRLEASAEMSRMQTIRARAKLIARQAISATAG